MTHRPSQSRLLDLLPLALLGLLASGVGWTVLRAPATSSSAPPPAAADPLLEAARAAESSQDAGAGAARVPSATDRAVRRRLLGSQSIGTYLPELLVAGDSALQRWPSYDGTPIRVWIHSPPGGRAPADWSPEHVGLARDAFRAWEQIGLPLRFRFVPDSVSADVRVTWVDQFEPDTRIGHTRRLHDSSGWIHEGTIAIAVRGTGGRVLALPVIRATALHEVGHLLGLGHTSDSTSVMAAETHDESTRLSPADRATAQLLYRVAPGSLKQ